MPRPADRWRKRTFVRTPSGKTQMRFKDKKSSEHTCGLCENELHGVPNGKKNSEVLAMAKTQKRPTRVFGGVLCSGCTTRIIEEASMVKTKQKELSAVSFSEKKFVEMALGKIGE
ncbi:MAG: 50S ribosomal protein L34e [archaeon]|nr:50S ribosomal protein L34e [archaeon]